MQFLKSKFGQLRDYSKSIFGKNKIVNSPKELLEHLMRDRSEDDYIEVYQQLAELSKNMQSNTEIANFIVLRLERFKYESGVMRQTQRLLSVTIYLLKNGSKGLALDIANNLSLLQELQKLDSKHFEAQFHKKAKLLDYQIEVIKHRAKFIQMLVTDEKLLDQQRQKAAIGHEADSISSTPEQVGRTSMGLKMSSPYQSQLIKQSLSESKSREMQAEQATCQDFTMKKNGRGGSKL